MPLSCSHCLGWNEEIHLHTNQCCILKQTLAMGDPVTWSRPSILYVCGLGHAFHSLQESWPFGEWAKWVLKTCPAASSGRSQLRPLPPVICFSPPLNFHSPTPASCWEFIHEQALLLHSADLEIWFSRLQPSPHSHFTWAKPSRAEERDKQESSAHYRSN